MSLLSRLLDVPLTGDRTASWLRRTVAVAGLALMAATWRLWTPQAVFPQVPLVAWALDWPTWLDWAGAAGMVATLLLALAVPQRSPVWRVALAVFALFTCGMVLIDQNRNQPWAYQFAIIGLLLALTPSRPGLSLVRLLTISFYAYSAISKLDYAFLHSLGQDFLAALMKIVGVSTAAWPEDLRLALSCLFPLGELLVGIGLCYRPTRSVALGAAVIMHVLLLVILGPLGLHHKPGVLIWNIYFIGQDLLLFGPWLRDGAEAKPPPPVNSPRFHRAGWIAAELLLALVITLPLLERWGWWDVWPSWGLYAPSGGRVALFINVQKVDRLPSMLKAYVVKRRRGEGGPYVEVRLDRWALDILDAPIYPENRFQLGAVEAVIQHYRLTPEQNESALLVMDIGPANHLDGRRTRRELTKPEDFDVSRQRFWFNSTARP